MEINEIVKDKKSGELNEIVKQKRSGKMNEIVKENEDSCLWNKTAQISYRERKP